MVLLSNTCKAFIAMKYFTHNKSLFVSNFTDFYIFILFILPHINSGFISSGLEDQSFYDLKCLCVSLWQNTEQDLAGRVRNYKDYYKIMTILSYYKIYLP